MGSNKLDQLRGKHNRQISVHSSIERKSEDLETDRKRHHRPELSVSISSERDRSLDFIPNPSKDPLDPLNWPRWKKELAYASLLTLSSTVGILKMVLVPVVSILASEFSCSYMAAASLTGLPILLGAGSALGSSVLSRRFGKRGILLVGAVLMFVGEMWNMHVVDVYAEFMCARSFQGVGWGLVEGVLGESISEMFFVHQRHLRMNLLNITNVVCTWTTPILGGYISYSHLGWRDQFMFSSIIQAISLLLLIFGTPETTYHRQSIESPTLPPGSRSLHQAHSTTTTTITSILSPFQEYVLSLQVFSSQGDSSKCKTSDFLLPLKALGAPSTVLSAILTAPGLATAYGIAHTFSLILAPAPTFLRPQRIGYLFVLPAIFAVVAQLTLVAILYFTKLRNSSESFSSSKSSRRDLSSLVSMIFAIIFSVGGIMGFGIYIATELSPQFVEIDSLAIAVLSEEVMGPSCLWTASCLFALLVAGCSVLTFTGEKTISTSQEVLGHEKGGSLLRTAILIHQEMLMGMFVCVFPLWVQSEGSGLSQMMARLRTVSIALAIVILVFGIATGVLLWVKDNHVGKMDKKVMGVKESLDRWKDDESFFDP